MASTTTEDPHRDAAMARQSSSSSCASQKANEVTTPYLRIMKTQLNFFMTRLLFMQEAEADSLGARRERKWNTSNSSFNNSGSRGVMADGAAVPPVSQQHQHDGLLGYFEEEENVDDDDICVFADNAKGLPNRVAKSMPPIPFPPAAPESPRPIEGKEGIVVKTPTHHPASPSALPEVGLGMPALGDMHLSDFDSAHTQMSTQSDNYNDDEETETEAEEDDGMGNMVVDDDADYGVDAAAAAGDEGQDEKAHPDDPMESNTTTTTEKSSKRSSVPAIPPYQRVFPKNQRRSTAAPGGAKSTNKRPSRSMSAGNRSAASGTGSDEAESALSD